MATNNLDAPVDETPKHALIAAAAPVAAHVIVFLIAFLGGGGAALLVGEGIIGLASLALGMVVFRRGRQYSGLGLVGGWLAGLLIVAVIFCL